MDLRWNGGGDSRVIGPLKSALAKGKAKVYALIGAQTFSSALMNAMEMQRELHATLVGEPAGGKPSGYGEVKTLTLPNSGLAVRYPSKYSGAPTELGEELRPDIAAPLETKPSVNQRSASGRHDNTTPGEDSIAGRSAERAQNRRRISCTACRRAQGGAMGRPRSQACGGKE